MMTPCPWTQISRIQPQLPLHQVQHRGVPHWQLHLLITLNQCSSATLLQSSWQPPFQSLRSLWSPLSFVIVDTFPAEWEIELHNRKLIQLQSPEHRSGTQNICYQIRYRAQAWEAPQILARNTPGHINHDWARLEKKVRHGEVHKDLICCFSPTIRYASPLILIWNELDMIDRSWVECAWPCSFRI